jgi:hypothetical protein
MKWRIPMAQAIVSLLGALTLALLASSGLPWQQMSDIESVEYDPIGNRYFISNTTHILVRSAEHGKLTVFGRDAAAEFGMEIMQGVLYAVVGAYVKGYDLENGKQVLSVAIPGTRLLNGMASDGDSLLWVTDTYGQTITQIHVDKSLQPRVQQIAAATPGQPNGIYHDASGNRLIFVNWGRDSQIQSLELKDKSLVTIKKTDRTNCDGITRDNQGYWYISCWGPEPGVFKIAPDFSGDLVSMPGTFSRPADMDFNPQAGLVVVPNASSHSLGFIP